MYLQMQILKRVFEKIKYILQMLRKPKNRFTFVKSIKRR